MTRMRVVVARHHGLGQAGLALAGLAFYELLRRLMTPDWPLAIRHARDVARWEGSIGVAWERPLQLAFLHAPDLVQVLDVFYVTGHFVVTAAFFVWLYRRVPDAFPRFRNAFLVATALSLVIDWSFPTAPPRLAGIGLEDTLRRLSDIDIGSRGSLGFSNPVAAVPSLHAGWALGVGLGVVLYGRGLWRIAGALYPPLVVLTILVTGNHFVLDAASGMAVMAVGFLATSRPLVTFLLRRGVEQSGSSPGS